MIIRCTLALALFTSLCPAAELSRGPYLQLAHEKGVTIVWRSTGEQAAPRVLFQEEGKEAVLVCEGEAILRRTTDSEVPLSKAPGGTVQYEATLTGLKPKTTYRYIIYDAEEALTIAGENHHFTTHPPIGEVTPTRIWVVGDSGTGQLHQQMVHDAMAEFAMKGKKPIDLYLHVGDMAYGQGTDPQFQDKFFAPYKDTLRNTVCWASMGNHEGISSRGKTGVGPFYDAYVCPKKGEAGGVASGHESFYSFDYGDIHFICLNSHDIDRSPTGEMAQWLVRDLAETKGRWIVGFWHHPPYTKGTHDSDRETQLVEMRKYIMPILEEGGVDIVLSGHSHIYERSMLVDGAYQTPTTAEGVVLDDGDGNPEGDGSYRKSGKVTPHNGTIAVVTGHGGALGRNAIGVIPIMRSIVMDHGSTILDIDGDTLTGVMLDLAGRERDRFAIVKRGVVEPSVIKDPWTPDASTPERTGHGVLGAPKTVSDSDRARKAGDKHPPLLMPKNTKTLIASNAEWDYLAGGEEPETEMWTKVGFDAREEGWKSGPAGFGYGDGDDRTELKDMRGKYTAIFVRKEFEIPAGTDLSKLGLVINYDDGFVLHVNGKELLSKEVDRDEKGQVSVGNHEASGAEYFSLSGFAKSFQIGKNVIALEGHNNSKASSDLSLDPALVVELGGK